MSLTFMLAETTDWALVSQRLPVGGHKSIDVGGNNSSVLYAEHKPNLAVWYRGLLRSLSCSRALGKITMSALGKTLAVKEEMYIFISSNCTLTATLTRLCGRELLSVATSCLQTEVKVNGGELWLCCIIILQMHPLLNSQWRGATALTGNSSE